MPTHPLLRRAALAAVGVIVALVAVPLGALAPSPAHGATSDEVRFFNLTNQLRASVGAPALSLDAGLSDVARGWSQQMANSGGISHNPSRGDQITGWSVLGENVGMGPSVDVIHQALVNSPHHYENLVSGEFTLVGIGVAYGPGMVYVTEDFMTPAGRRAAPPAPEPEPEPVYEPPAPAPAPRAEPAPTTTAAPAPEPVAAPEPAPAPVAAPDPVPAQLRPIVEELRQWTAVFFPGSDPSIALNRDASHSGDGG